MRITHDGLTYEITPDTLCWQLSTVRVNDAGDEYTHNVVYPGTLPAALRSLLDRMVRDGLEPDADLAETVATVAHLYATIGSGVDGQHRTG